MLVCEVRNMTDIASVLPNFSAAVLVFQIAVGTVVAGLVYNTFLKK